MSDPYLDTSALAKWYLNEPGSLAFQDFIVQHKRAAISRLTIVEFRCLLARRLRARELSVQNEADAFRLLQSDIAGGFLLVHPLHDTHAQAALDLIERLRRHPLRTLDALHLAIALDSGAALLATADRMMVRAAKTLGLPVATFAA